MKKLCWSVVVFCLLALPIAGQTVIDPDELMDLPEQYRFEESFIGELIVSYPEGWEVEGDEISGAIFIGESLEFSSQTGTVMGTPTNIMILAYPSEIEIADFDEITIFETYVDFFADTLDITEDIEGELVEINDQLMYYVTFDFFMSSTTFLFLHEDNNLVALQGITEENDVDLINLLLSIASTVEVDTALGTNARANLLTAEHTTTFSEGDVTFSYPDSWEVLDEPFDTEPVVISNDIDVFTSEDLPPLGAYGIRISAHGIPENGQLVRQDGESFTPQEILEIVLGDEITSGTVDTFTLENAQGVIHYQLAGGYTLITQVFNTDDDLTVFMQGVASARDAGQLQPVFDAVTETFSFERFDN